MKKFWIAGVAIAAVMIIGAPSAAHADCEPREAWEEVKKYPAQGIPTITVDNPDHEPETTVMEFDHWQRYSHNGAWHSNTEAPPFPGNWQANTKSDPHNVGVAGAYYRSNGNSGKGDWFYLEAVTKTVTTPAKGSPTKEVPNPEYVEAYEETIFHEAIECPVTPEEPVDPVDPVDPVYPEEPNEPETPQKPEEDAPAETEEVSPVKSEASPENKEPEALAVTGVYDVIPRALVGGLLIIAGATLIPRKNTEEVT